MSIDESTEKRLYEATARYADNAIDDSELTWLNDTLRNNEAARQQFAEVALDALTVAEHFRNEDQLDFVGDEDTIRATRPRHRLLTLIPILVAVAASVALAFQFIAKPAVVDVAVAHVDGNQGDVQILRQDALIEVSDLTTLFVGDRIQTGSGGSNAVIVYADGTRVLLGDGGSIRLADGPGKHVVLEQGNIMVAARPQPPQLPMIIDTPDSQIQVVGTKFAVSAVGRKTELGVIEGKVLFRNDKLGRQLSVASGQRATSDGHQLTSELLVAPDDYRAIFDGEALGKWRLGKITPQDDDSWTLRAQPVNGHLGTHHKILSPDAWVSPLCKVHEDSVLRFTYRMNKGVFFHVLLLSRSDYAPRPDCFNVEWKKQNFGRLPTNQWITEEIPLRDLIPPDRDGSAVGRNVTSILFDTQIENAGFELKSLEIVRDPTFETDH